MDERTWRAEQAAHRRRVEPWITPRLERRRRGAKQATDDFLFEYYPFSPNKLLTWHPGFGVVLEGAADEFLEHPAYVRTDDGITVTVEPLRGRARRLDVAIRILDGTQGRQPNLGCFALHEWAMVYGLAQDEIRHDTLPLRLSPAEIRATVDQLGLRCTHIDAYRFFTPSATPINAFEPSRATQPDIEQPGCLHANMDLYKYAMWFSPHVPSELIADAFALARQARSLDMRASPYEVASIGLDPIRIETPEGRRAYAVEQQSVMSTTEPLRDRLLSILSRLRQALGERPAVA